MGGADPAVTSFSDQSEMSVVTQPSSPIVTTATVSTPPVREEGEETFCHDLAPSVCDREWGRGGGVGPWGQGRGWGPRGGRGQWGEAWGQGQEGRRGGQRVGR